MKRRLRIAWLPDGKRLHLKDGPMDVIIQAFGRPGDIARAYDSAITRMRIILDELNAELPSLRQAAPRCVEGALARRMNEAVLPYCGNGFITPMAAASGAVADDVLAVMLESGELERAFVNNGGDIALHLVEGQNFTLGAIDRLNRSHLPASFAMDWGANYRGIATSGWAGPGYSMGIADAVTVCAASAAAADAASTIIANAATLCEHPAICRAPARSLDPESDLGDRLVTTRVGLLAPAERAAAIAAGVAMAEKLCAAGLIGSAVLMVQGEVATVRLDEASRALVMERIG